MDDSRWAEREQSLAGESPGHRQCEGGCALSRREKRKAMKKQKRKQMRKDAAVREKEEEEALANDPEEQMRARLRDQEEEEAAERARKEFEERERLWLEAAEARSRKAQEEEEAEKNKILEEESRQQQKDEVDDDEWEYVEEGPAEIIWKENEIIVKKKRVKVPKRSANQGLNDEEDDRPTSNPLPPQSVAFASFKSGPPISAQELLESVAQQTPKFGTEQDKTHCPFHLKTGVCRFGSRCNRTHFYPNKSCTMLMKNMYGGPGLAWEQDEELEYTEEEIERSFEEFYEDVHTEFLKFGEIINFKVCRNGSSHLRGNVYVHYRNLESAVLAYSSINGRYFAGKQISCEFVGVTKWRVAICGEYMKSRLKTCSRGTACNFIHCFRNPGGEYEWADWDNPPPKYWAKKMALLFGSSDNFDSSNILDADNGDLQEMYRGRATHASNRGHYTSSSGRSLSGRRGSWSNSTHEREHEEKDHSNVHHLEMRYSPGYYSPRENERGEKRSYAFENDEKSKNEFHQKRESHKKRGRRSLHSHTKRGCFYEEHNKGGSMGRNHKYYHDDRRDSPDWDFDIRYEDAYSGDNRICRLDNETSSGHASDDSSQKLEELDDSLRKSSDIYHVNEKRYSNSKRKHHRREAHESGVQTDGDSGSAELGLSKNESKKGSRSGTPIRHTDSSKKKERHNDHDYGKRKHSLKKKEKNCDHDHKKRKRHRQKTHENGERTDGHSDSAGRDSR